MTCRPFLLSIAIILVAVPASAESLGWTVYTAREKLVDVRLVAVSSDTLVCLPGDRSDYLSIPISEIVLLERKHGSGVLGSMGLGLLIGGGMGALGGLMAGGDIYVPVYGIAGAVFGFVLGAVAGATSSDEVVTPGSIPVGERTGAMEYLISYDEAPPQ